MRLKKQAKQLPRADVIRETLDNRTWLVLAAGMDEAVAICNRYAPKHLSVIVRDEAAVLPNTILRALFSSKALTGNSRRFYGRPQPYLAHRMRG